MTDQEKERKIQLAYRDGWRAAQKQINWELKALKAKNTILENKIQEHEKLSLKDLFS